MTTIPNTTVETEVLTCPACRTKVYATLLVGLRLGEIKATDLDAVNVAVDSQIVGLAVSHRCGGAEPPAEEARDA